MKGTLYLVATPIGNLEDITLRAVRILQEVDMVAAEDTRQTLKLLNHLGITKTLTSYHEHNRVQKGSYLVEKLLEGRSIALVSDAGTPGISDPGEDIVREALDHGITVTAVPGPVAAVTGLVVSGMPAGRFAFEGFLPMNKRARRDRIAELKHETRTIIFYEAPHKLVHTLKDLYGEFGNRKIALARELTKKFEEVIRCTLEEAVAKYSGEPARGEFVLILEGADEDAAAAAERESWNETSLEEHLEIYIKQGMSKKDAIKKVAEDRGTSRREVYKALLETAEDDDISSPI